MKNSSLKGALGALAVVGGIFAAKKISEKKKFMKGICDEFGIKEKTPFGFADRIREMSDEQYNELKDKMKANFGGKCCSTSKCCEA